jgi:hypothetical protein
MPHFQQRKPWSMVLQLPESAQAGPTAPAGARSTMAARTSFFASDVMFIGHVS